MVNNRKNQPKSSEILDSPLFFYTEEIVLEKKHRCIHCNKLLGVEQLVLPILDIKCSRCGSINSISVHNARQIIITDKDGVILFVNEEVVAATGYSHQEILGNTLALWGNQMTRGFYEDLWQQISTEKKAVVVKLLNKHKDGKLYPLILRISPILDIDGNIELFIGLETKIEATTNN